MMSPPCGKFQPSPIVFSSYLFYGGSCDIKRLCKMWKWDNVSQHKYRFLKKQPKMFTVINSLIPNKCRCHCFVFLPRWCKYWLKTCLLWKAVFCKPCIMVCINTVIEELNIFIRSFFTMFFRAGTVVKVLWHFRM